MVKRLPNWLLIGLLLVAPAALAAAQIEVKPDRTDVRLNESFELVFSTSGAVDDEPDFTPLEQDFEILSQSQNQSLRIISGQTDRERAWSLTLMPRRAGALQVPPIAFGSDRSPALSLNVGAERIDSGTADDEVFIEVETDTTRTWVQAEVVMTVRLYHAPELRGGRLSSPTLEGDADAVIEILGDDRSYHTQRNDRRYFVIERRFVVFPQSAGQRRFLPVGFQGQIIEPASRFDPFRQRTRTVRLQSESLPLDVRPIPAEFAGKPWLPARSLQLAEHWSDEPPRLVQGEPATRTLALIADGLLASQLPELTTALPDTLKQYPDQPRLETQKKDTGVIGLREEKHAIIASQPGRIELPGFEILWFDTSRGRAEITRLPPRTLDVAAGLNPSVGIAVAPPAVGAPVIAADGEPGSAFWPTLSSLLGGGWLLTLLAWWWTRRAGQPRPHTPAAQTSPGAALKDLQQACARADATEVERALLDWAGARWPHQTPRSLGAIGRRLGEPAASEIRRLEACRYSAAAALPWQADALYTAISTYTTTGPGADAADAALPRLHPNLN